MASPEFLQFFGGAIMAPLFNLYVHFRVIYHENAVSVQTSEPKQIQCLQRFDFLPGYLPCHKVFISVKSFFLETMEI